MMQMNLKLKPELATQTQMIVSMYKMKKISLRITILFCILIASQSNLLAQNKNSKKTQASAMPQGKGALYFDNLTVSFGKISENQGIYRATFYYKNISNVPVNIISIQTDCGCTVAETGAKAVPPLTTGSIVIAFDPTGRAGNIKRTISVTTDADPSIYYLNLIGIVDDDSRRIKAEFPFEQGNMRINRNFFKHEITENKHDSFYIKMINVGKAPIMINKVVTPHYIKAEYPSSQLMENGTIFIKLVVYGDLANDLGRRNEDIIIVTNDQKVPNKMVSMSVVIKQDFEAMPPKVKANPPAAQMLVREHDFGESYKGEVLTHRFEIKNTGKSDLIIRRVKSDCGCTVGNYSKEVIKKGKTGFIEVKLNTKDLRFNVQKDVFVYTNDPKQPEILLTVKTRTIIPGIDPLEDKK
jgi:hypothetical protein